MNESRVRINAWAWFERQGFQIIAGQPPNGCGKVPTIEIKSEANKAKGSKGSFKPDLIAINYHQVIVIECKPLFSEADELKLEAIKNHLARRQSLYRELHQRRLFFKHGLDKVYVDYRSFEDRLTYCLANCENVSPRKYVLNLNVGDPYESSTLVYPDNWGNRTRIDLADSSHLLNP
jgi:hypothetical protein